MVPRFQLTPINCGTESKKFFLPIHNCSHSVFIDSDELTHGLFHSDYIADRISWHLFRKEAHESDI